jgi:apolipoprotein N-acyltransferase
MGRVLLVAALGAVRHAAVRADQLVATPVVRRGACAARVLVVSVRRAAVLGLAFGTAWLAAGVWWLFISMHRYGNLPAWMAALAVLALALALSIYLALAMAAVARWRSGSLLRDTIYFSAAWLLAELARTWLFTGFPWLASGYAQVDSPLAVLAPWLGVLGIGAVLAAIAALWARAASHRVTATASVGVAAFAGVGWPAVVQPTGATLGVSLLQTNVPQDEVRHRAAAQYVARADGGPAAARGQLVIAPETAVPLLPSQLDEVAPGYGSAV